MRSKLACMLCIFFAASSAFAGEPHFPGARWEAKSPAELELQVERLQAIEAALGGRGCIVKDGYVVHSWGAQAEKSDWYSSAKPVLSTLLMFAIHEGKVASPDAQIADFGWELAEKDRAMTFRHLASMTSGYARPERPGAAWAYNDFAIQLYQKTLFDRVFKEAPEAAANSPARFGALQLEDGLSFRESNRRLSASVRDFARIAWFWLNRGRWHDRQLLPTKLFDDNLRPQVPPELPETAKAETNDYLKIGSFGGGSDHFSKHGPGIYGFNWWFNATGREHPETPTWPDAPRDTVMSVGFAGNCAALMPSLNLVVVSASGDWGKLDVAQADSVINQRLKLIAWAGTPSTKELLKQPVPEPSLQRDAATITGELKQWHRITLTFPGPASDESATPNPFRDFRLNVTFTNGKRIVVVPGYFAADGYAGETGATGGNCWRVHFTPDAIGEWKYLVSFRAGEAVAISDMPDAGSPLAPDGLAGEFVCMASDKSGRDFRAHGMLNYVGERYLRFAGSKHYFLKSGADSPENLLAYTDFDDTKPTHAFGPHALDFRVGDPTWRDGRGRNLIGAVNYLASVGVNSIYMLLMNVQGDGKDVWPWTSDTERMRFDCSKLDQWEFVFAHMDRLGLMQHFVLQEQENDQLLDNGELGSERRLYFRELIARFAHHPAITWNLGEENTNTLAQRQAFATFFHEHDPYRHMVVIHTFPNQIETVYSGLLGYKDLDGASLQTNGTHVQTKQWIQRSGDSGRPWVVCLDEIGPADTGVKPDRDDFNHDEVRKLHLWGHFMASGAGVEWLFGYKFAHNDINLEDFRSRDQLWRQCRNAVEFFQDQLPFTEMHTADELLDRDDAYCFAKPGTVYAVYVPDATKETHLRLPSANYSVRWFEARRGSKLLRGSVPSVRGGDLISLGQPPRDPERDWLILVKLDGPAPKQPPE